MAMRSVYRQLDAPEHNFDKQEARRQAVAREQGRELLIVPSVKVIEPVRKTSVRFTYLEHIRTDFIFEESRSLDREDQVFLRKQHPCR